MNIPPGSAALRAPVPAKTDPSQSARPADPSAHAQTTAQRTASPSGEAPRQDKVVSAYRIERPMPQPRPNAPRGSTVNLVV